MSFRIKYFIPEDGDDFDHPNIFNLNANGGSPTLEEVRKSFPVPGTYHFRFLRTLNDMKVWIDLANDNDLVPIFDGQIIAKVSRLTAPSRNTHATTSRPVAAAPTKAPSAPQPVASAPSKPSKTASLIDDQEDLFGLSNSAPAQNAASAAEPDLLGFSSPAAPVPQAASNPDLFGLDTFSSAPAPTKQTTPAAPAIQLQRAASNTQQGNQGNQGFGAPQGAMPMRGGPMGMGNTMGGPMGGGGAPMMQPTRGLSQPPSARGSFDGNSAKQGINIDPFGNLGGVKK